MDDVSICYWSGFECKELTDAWREFNELYNAYVALKDEVRILRAVVEEINTKPPQLRQYCKGCSLLKGINHG